MSSAIYEERLKMLIEQHNETINMENEIDESWTNGVFNRYINPVLTRDHAPLFWKYDLNPETNPYLMERIGVNGVYNSGAIYLDGKYYMVARIEGNDRKSFFGVAESDNPVQGWKFWDYPIKMPPDTISPETNVYDMRLTQHEDGWIYGVFCAERKDPDAPAGDQQMATATTAICRTKDLKTWERLPDLVCDAQQRNVVLHPEFVDGKYAFYTRPQDGFIAVGSGGGIGWALVDDIEHAMIEKGQEVIIDEKKYHTIKEVKNGAGITPIKTDKGWLHVAHGVRENAAGLRYVIYAFMTDLNEPWKVIHAPAGHLIAPLDWERVGDVSDVVFICGAIENEAKELYLYYASSDTRMHVASTTVEKLVDYCMNTPEDPYFSYLCVDQRCDLISRNLEYMNAHNMNKEELR